MQIKTILRNSPDEFSALILTHYSTSLAHVPGRSRDLPKNYSPLALTSALIKLLEKFVAMNIYKSFETRQKMNPKQNGFRSGRSCLSQLLGHHNKILAEFQKPNNVDVVHSDFAKAFDKVDQRILLNNLKKIGIDGKVGVWTHNFL